MKKWAYSGWSALAMLFFISSGMAQEARKEMLYSYTVPFICGSSVESFQEGVVSGVHATAINIHNPSAHFKAVFNKSVSRALPFQRSDTITPTEEHVLAKREAIEVECHEIRMKLPNSMTSQFRTGFLVITSENPLNVAAIYTSRPSNGEVSTIDMEVIEPQVSERKPHGTTFTPGYQ